MDYPEIWSTTDVDERIEELESELADYARDDDHDLYCIFLHEEEEMEIYEDLHDVIDPLVTLLSDLNDFRNELIDYVPDWKYGEPLIHEDYREDYARQLADDITTIPNSWPHRHIDWEAATKELFQFDYTHAEIEGETYYVRCH